MRANTGMKVSALALVLACGTSAGADTLRVPGDFATIQEAISAASAGDVVLVAPGVYAETIDFLGKSIVVRGEAGAGATTIDAQGRAEWVVTFSSGESAEAVLEGFTITGGDGSARETFGGGILIDGASPVLRDLVVSGNAGIEGGGIHAASAGATLIGVDVAQNRAVSGAGIYALASNLVLERVTVRENRSSTNGSGVFALGGSLTGRDVALVSNVGGGLGGGLYAGQMRLDLAGVRSEANGDFEQLDHGGQRFGTFGGAGMYLTRVSGLVRDVVLEDNGSFAGGGLYVASDSRDLTVVNLLSRGNISGIGGGAYFNDSRPVIVNATIIHNTVGGVYTTAGARPVVINSVIAGNEAYAYEDVDVYGAGRTRLSYSVVGSEIFDLAVDEGPGVVQDVDPRLDADGRPTEGSPAIDAGSNSAVPEGVIFDLGGLSRFVDDPQTPDTGEGAAPIVDAGAFEFQPSRACLGDMNGDDRLDGQDLLMFLSMFFAGDPGADLTGDGRLDGMDLLMFLEMFYRGC